MSESKWFQGITLRSGEDLTSVLPGAGPLFKAIGVDGQIAATGSEAIGLLKYGAGSGEFIDVAWIGEVKYVAGEAIGAGERVTVTTSGYLVKISSGALAVGRNAENAVSSGAVGRGLFDFSAPPISEQNFGQLSFAADNDLSTAGAIGKAINVASGNYAVGSTGTGVLYVGTTSGGQSQVRTHGVLDVNAGGVITANQGLSVITSGAFVLADSGDVVVGRSVDASAAGNSGGNFRAIISFATQYHQIS